MSSIKPKLRFAALVRVSTEQQEKQGESLRTQRTQNEKDVQLLGGTVVAWYGGQEHATPGYEKKEVDRLIADAAKGQFDAVIVTNADRWSRDNTKSTQGREAFKKQGIRFYVSVSEYDLFNPEHELFLNMSSAIGQFQASNQSRKSLLNRIHRAKRGIPVCGKLPFGRLFDQTSGWHIDHNEKALIEDVAQRYLAGEPLAKLAEEYGRNHANLHKVLTRRCGDTWEQVFDSDSLNIHEVVVTQIPRLLPDATIKAIRKKAEANKTYQHKQAKHPYLFGRMVFCNQCGYAMFGQTNPNGHRYYRHAHTKRVKACNCPKAWVRAEDLEDAIIRHLFECFGNPQAVKKAIEEATPNLDQVHQQREQVARLEVALAKTGKVRERILSSISRELISDADAESQLERLKQQEATQRTELDRLNDMLANVPTPESIQAVSKEVSGTFKRFKIDAAKVRLNAKTRLANRCLEEMTWEEKRALAEMVFSGKRADGSRMGVYIAWIGGQEKRRRKTWKYTISGHLIQRHGKIPMKLHADEEHGDFCGPDKQDELNEIVTKSASY